MRFKQKKIHEQVIVITGATSGIGLETARLAARSGARVVLAARNSQALKQVVDEIRARGGKAISVPADVACLADVQYIADQAIAKYGRFDTWVNNAGVSMFGRLMEIPIEDERRLFDVNFWGVVNGSRVALRHLKQHGGTLINIGSVLSNRAISPQGTYSASKHAVKAFTDALRMELEKARAPVVVNLIKPSSIDTPLPRHARNYTDAEVKLPPPYYAPEVVARAIIHCAQKKHRDVILGSGAALIWLEKLAPRVTDLLLRDLAYPLQRNEEKPPRQKDTLYEPPEHEGETRGGYEGYVAETSLYGLARLHSTTLLLAAAVVVAGAAAATAGTRSRRARGIARRSVQKAGKISTQAGQRIRFGFRRKNIPVLRRWATSISETNGVH